MDDGDLKTASGGITTADAITTAAGTEDVQSTLPLDGSTVDYSPDDEDLDEAAATAAAEATRDTLADGLVARLLRPCVDRLDASVQCTRLSQLDLKLQLDSLATELKRLSLAQHDYLFCISSPQSPSNKTTGVAVTANTATDTCALLDGSARRLCEARAKIAVVGNILESTQERLRALSHRIGREHNNRRSLLEPPAVMTNVSDEFELELDDDKEKNETEEPDDIINNKELDMNATERGQSVDDAKIIETSPAASETLIS